MCVCVSVCGFYVFVYVFRTVAFSELSLSVRQCYMINFVVLRE